MERSAALKKLQQILGEKFAARASSAMPQRKTNGHGG